MKNRNIQVRITEITYPFATRNCNEFISCGGILRQKNGEKKGWSEFERRLEVKRFQGFHYSRANHVFYLFGERRSTD